MDNAVALAALGIVGSCVAGLVWIIKYLFTEFKPLLNSSIQKNDENTKATQENTKTLVTVQEQSAETLQFMKNLNGKLTKATIQTVQEQHVQHQTVENQEIDNHV